jgi:arylsulfatase A-like enzyme
MDSPNFVIIVIDDMGWRDLGCYGSSFHLTPNIDRLAAQGMRFTDAYAAAPVCSPTRASIMTGCYPARLHLTDWIPGYVRPGEKLLNPEWSPRLPAGQATIATVLARHGYLTASIGKWHLDGTPLDHGFAEASLYRKIQSHFYPYYSEPPQIEGQDGEYFADRLTDEALAFIRENRCRPFLLYLGHNGVHRPLQAREAAIDRYRRRIQPGDPQNNPIYAAMVESIDDSAGRVMAALDEAGIADNTVVVFVSDNGGLAKAYNGQIVTSNEPLRQGKGTLYEGGIRVPLIVRYPAAVQPASVTTVPVSTVDFLPTVAALAGVPHEMRPQCDGENIEPVLCGAGELKRKALYWHYPHYHECAPCGAIRQGDEKLVEYFEDGRVELYNLRTDMAEANDLNSAEPARAGELRQALHDWRASVGAQMPVPAPRDG